MAIRRRAAPPKFITRTHWNRFIVEKYRRKALTRSYKVTQEQGTGADWRVTFYIDGEERGGGQFQAAQQADDAGVDFMFDEAAW